MPYTHTSFIENSTEAGNLLRGNEVYAIHIPGSEIFKFCKLSKKQLMLDELEIHVRSMAIQSNHSIALKRHDLLSDRIYKVCLRYIPCIYYAYTRYVYGIYHVYTMNIPCDGDLQARLVARPRLEASDRDFRRSFSVLATERSPTRGWGCPKFHNQVLIS